MSNKEFPDELKLADVTPIDKKMILINLTLNLTLKSNPNKSKPKNYRPVSVLPAVSKVFDKIMHDQISQYINCFLIRYLCGYRKGFSTQ